MASPGDAAQVRHRDVTILVLPADARASFSW
jgi:hypothetical protein